MDGNVFKDIAEIGEDIGKGIEKVFSIVDKTAKVLDTVVKDESTFKPALEAAVTGAVTLASDIATVVSEKGINWTEDDATVAAVEAYFKTTILTDLVPEVEKLYGDITVDIEPVAPQTPPAATTTD